MALFLKNKERWEVKLEIIFGSTEIWNFLRDFIDKAIVRDVISRRVYSGVIWVDKSARFLESTPRDIIAPGEIDENFRCQILIEDRNLKREDSHIFWPLNNFNFSRNYNSKKN